MHERWQKYRYDYPKRKKRLQQRQDTYLLRAQDQPHWKRYTWAAVIVGIVYLALFLIVPLIVQLEATPNEEITKAEAMQKAQEYAAQELGLTGAQALKAVYSTDDVFYGYVMKKGKDYQTENTDLKQALTMDGESYDALKDYNENYLQYYAPEYYRVTIPDPDEAGRGTTFVYVGLYDGRVNGYQRLHAATGQGFPQDVQAAEMRERMEQEAERYLTAHGIQAKLRDVKNGADDVDALRSTDDHMILDYERTDAPAFAEAKLMLAFKYDLADGTVTRDGFKQYYDAPQSYKVIVAQEDAKGYTLNTYGFLWPTIVLIVLSLIYAIIYRQYTSFRRGWVFVLTCLACHLINTFNAYDTIYALVGETYDGLNGEFLTMVVACMNLLLSIGIFVIGTYFCLVGGEGIWRHEGRRLWPKFRQAWFGDHVWRSMKLGYIMAILIMMVQQILFMILASANGMWTTSSAESSPLNNTWIWLMPIMAWTAGIAEEALYRFFGIGLFRKWFRSTIFASILSSLIWALGHVTYPIYPSTTRMFEVFVLGLIFSYIFIKFGLYTAIFAHVIMDSIMMSLSIMLVGGVVNIVLGVFYIVLPILVAWLLRFWHRRYRARSASSATVGPRAELE
jgi:hypothetical protein